MHLLVIPKHSTKFTVRKLKKNSVKSFTEIRKVGAALIYAEIQTDMTGLIGAFRE
jgi:hypothetical protein